MKKPTNSASFFKGSGQGTRPPATQQPTKVMQNLVTALPPDAELPVVTNQVKPVAVSMEGMERVTVIDLPKAPVIVDNAVSNNPFESETLDSLIQGPSSPPLAVPEFPKSFSTKTKAVVVEPKQERTVHQIPKISELPVSKLAPAIVTALHQFKGRTNVDYIVESDRAHADYGPSSGERIVNCQAATALEYLRGHKEEHSEYATEGSLAHEIAEAFVTAKFEGLPYPEHKFLHSKYTKEMFTHGVAYAEYCYKACEEYLQHPYVWAVEERICVDNIRDAWGTLDFGLVARVGDKLHIVLCDYKYGMGVEVDTENEETGVKNWQLALYALGLVGKFLKIDDGGILVAHSVTAHIFQPRVAEAVAPVVFSLDELLGHYLPTFLNAVDIAESFVVSIQEAQERRETWDTKQIEPYQNVGKWCQFCKGKTLCRAYQDKSGVPKALDMFKAALSGGFLTKEEKQPVKAMYNKGVISRDDLAFLALNASKIKSLIDDFAPTVIDLLNAGENLPVQLDRTEGRRGWIDDQDKVVAALQLMGIENPLKSEPKLIGISEAEKELGKGKIDDLTVKGEGSVKVVAIGKAKNPVAVAGGAAVLFKEHFEAQK